jgi:hypothetical protein
MVGCDSTATEVNIEEINRVQEALKQELTLEKKSVLPVSIQTVNSKSDEGFAE